MNISNWNYPLKILYSPVNYYYLNNNSLIGENDNLVVDNLNSLNLTTNNTIFNQTGGILGDGSFEFNGVNSSIFSNRSSGFNLTYPFTISAFVLTGNNKTQIAVSLVSNASSGNPADYYQFGLSNNRGLILARNGTLSATGLGTSVENFTWVHLTAVFESPTSKRLYQNGVLAVTSTTAVTINQNRSYMILVGMTRQSDNADAFNGSIDEVVYYNKSLTPGEVFNLYSKYNSSIPNIISNSNTTALMGYNQYGNFSITRNGQYYDLNLNNVDFKRYDLLKIWFRTDKSDTNGYALELRDINNSKMRYNINSNTRISRRNNFVLNNSFIDQRYLNLTLVYPYQNASNFNWSNVIALRIAEEALDGGNANFSVDDIRLTQIAGDTNGTWYEALNGDWAIVNDTGINKLYGLTYQGSDLLSRVAYITYPINLTNFEYSYQIQEYNNDSGNPEAPANIHTFWSIFKLNILGEKGFDFKDRSPQYITYVRSNITPVGGENYDLDNTTTIKGRDSNNLSADTTLENVYNTYKYQRNVTIRVINNNIKLFLDGVLKIEYNGNLSDLGNISDYVRSGYIAFRNPGNALIQSVNNITIINYNNLSYYVNSSYQIITNSSGDVIDNGTIPSSYILMNNDNYTFQLQLGNLNNALYYYSNMTAICTNLNSCNGNLNTSLYPYNSTYVLDNFNLTEGVTRQFSPLSISGSSTSKTITSQLSQAINATVVVDVQQCSFSATYKGNGINEDSCSNNVATFTLTDIPAGASELALQYLDINCSSNTGASVVIILIFSALAIVALTFIIVMKFREGELDVKLLIVVFIAIIVGLVLFTQIAQLTGSVCN